ncbi:MAG TPA: class I SAM-dependent methyltransferase [Steroidobacteraceae bacterium]|nr:class I SAM-dependent methyltransferase [Steroidobacteraceae bacterium]
MKAASLLVPVPGAHDARNAWTEFWKDPAQTRCASGDPDVWRALTAHWTDFARTLAPGERVLDLGCGAGAVGKLLLAARPDLHVTGVDSARIPLSLQPQHELLPDTAMEALPFEEQRFGAVVSQFGYEYGQADDTVREMARVVARGAKLSLIVHHEASPVVAATRERLAAIDALLMPAVRAAFCGGDAATFHAQMASLTARFATDDLVAELAASLTVRLGRVAGTRLAIWRAIEDALAPERCVARALSACCVGAGEMAEWLAPLRAVFDLAPVTLLRDSAGAPIAWRVCA